MLFKTIIALCVLFLMIQSVPYGDFCKQYDCSGKTEIDTTLPLAAIPTEVVEHKLTDGVFAYYTNITFTAAATNETSFNKIAQFIEIKGVPVDPCKGGPLCSMGIVLTTDYPIDWHTTGQYFFRNHTLSFYPILQLAYPPHNVTTTYVVSYMTCIENPLKPHSDPCLRHLQKQAHSQIYYMKI